MAGAEPERLRLAHACRGRAPGCGLRSFVDDSTLEVTGKAAETAEMLRNFAHGHELMGEFFMLIGAQQNLEKGRLAATTAPLRAQLRADYPQTPVVDALKQVGGWFETV